MSNTINNTNMLKGTHHNPDAKKKIAESKVGKPSWNKGKTFTKESRQKMSVAKKGKKMSEDFKKKRSEIMQERWKDPAFKQQMSEKHTGSNNPNYGKQMSDDQKEKLRVAALNRPESWRQKQSESHTGRKDSSETKLKKSKAHAGEKCQNWKGGITPVYKHIRGHRRYKEWCKAVLDKYNHTDVFTNKRGGRLSCHHVIPVNTLIKDE